METTAPVRVIEAMNSSRNEIRVTTQTPARMIVAAKTRIDRLSGIRGPPPACIAGNAAENTANNE
jgi:hypothetical protein